MPSVPDGLKWLTEKHFVALLGVPRSTYYSWEREGLLARPRSGAYRETQIVEALLIAALRPHLSVPATRNAMQRLRETELLAALTERFRERRGDDRVDAIVDIEIGEVAICSTDDELINAVRDPRIPKTVCVIPLGPSLRRAMTGFHNNSHTHPAPTKRSRGRPRTGSADMPSVVPLRHGE